jgi:hypothetical protein
VADLTFQQAYTEAVSANILYTRYQSRWQFLMDSYQGGESYRNGTYLQRYTLESDREYQLRLQNVPLDNQCRGLISLYTSFLFRIAPVRDFGSLDGNPVIDNILEDADLDGRSMDAFMKDVATWSSVFGHVWVCVAKPSVGATSLAEELALNARPYLSLYTPLAVLDWTWERQPNGGYSLSYIKVLEEVNGEANTVVEWTRDTITSYTINQQKKTVESVEQLPNELGRLPFVCIYGERSPVRGIGQSLIDDIADQQRMIYNELAEVYDSIRLDTHPSLVATEQVNTQGASAGQVITIPETMDPNLKPYVLQFQGGQIDKIYASINERRNMIDGMANVGSVRSSQTRDMSGIAIETEFQLLNARLSGVADNLELGEEQIWQEVCQYLGQEWTGSIEYPDDYALRNISNELDQLAKMKQLTARPEIQAEIDSRIAEILDIDTLEGEMTIPPVNAVEAMAEIEQEGMINGCPLPMTDKQTNIANHLICVEQANLGPASVTNPGVFWIQRADRLNIMEIESKSQTCSNCGYYVNTQAIKDCYSSNMAAGNIPLATEVNPAWENVPNPAGYCVKWDITCTPARTCDDWAPGGPIVN